MENSSVELGMLAKDTFLLIVLNFLSCVRSLQFFLVSGVGEHGAMYGILLLWCAPEIIPADPKACPTICLDGHLGIIICALSLPSETRIFFAECIRDLARGRLRASRFNNHRRDPQT
jgi:hypothetical protein